MVKIGQLFLAGGECEGEQLVSGDWVERTGHLGAGRGRDLGRRLGYQWWTATVDGSEAFRAVGYGGELIQVIPRSQHRGGGRHGGALRRRHQHGIGISVLLSILEDGVVAHFPDA